MQMFNGCNMKILSSYMVNFGAEAENKSSEEQEVRQESSYERIDREIKELDDGSNTENDKMEIQWTLNTEFSNSLKGKLDDASKLYEAIVSINFEDDKYANMDPGVKLENEKAMNDLKAFLEPIVHSVEVKDEDNIEGAGETGWDFYKKNLDNKEGAINQTVINEQIDKIESTIWSPIVKWSEYEQYQKTINNIKKVLDHPNTENTKALQKFILRNLEQGEDRTAFLKWSFKGGKEDNPDWLFGQNTFNWLHKFLKKLEEHIDNLKKADEAMKRNNESVGNDKSGSAESDKNKSTETSEGTPWISDNNVEGEKDNLTLGSLINDEKLKQIFNSDDNIKELIGNIWKIEKSEDLIQVNKNNWEKITANNKKISEIDKKLQDIDQQKKVYKEVWNSRKQRNELFGDDVNKLKEDKKTLEKSNSILKREIRKNEDTIFFEWSKNQQIRNWLVKLESKLIDKYRSLVKQEEKAEKDLNEALWKRGGNNEYDKKVDAHNKTVIETYGKKSVEINGNKGAILSFLWLKVDDNWKIVDDDNKSDFRKYLEKINKALDEEKAEMKHR